VITDVCMPGFSGLEVLAALRETAPALRVIVITAFGNRDTHDEAERLGASAFFEKPFDPVSLAAEIEGLLVGFLLARVYYGEFGTLEPAAVMDTIGVLGSGAYDQLLPYTQRLTASNGCVIFTGWGGAIR